MHAAREGAIRGILGSYTSISLIADTAPCLPRVPLLLVARGGSTARGHISVTRRLPPTTGAPITPTDSTKGERERVDGAGPIVPSAAHALYPISDGRGRMVGVSSVIYREMHMTERGGIEREDTIPLVMGRVSDTFK